MTCNYTVKTTINRPVAEVFHAILSREVLARYFVDASSGDLEVGTRVLWHWNEWGDFPVNVKTIESNKIIELSLNSKDWKKTTEDSYDVLVIFEFAALEGGATMLSISEHGWKTDTEGLTGSHENCSGWTHMTMCLKGYIEHDIDLR